MSDSESSPVVRKVKRKRRMQVSDDSEEENSQESLSQDAAPKKYRLSRRVNDGEEKTQRATKEMKLMKQEATKQKKEEDRKRKLAEQQKLQQTWRCAWCECGWEVGKKLVKQHEDEEVGSLCARCGVRFQKGKGKLLKVDPNSSTATVISDCMGNGVSSSSSGSSSSSSSSGSSGSSSSLSRSNSSFKCECRRVFQSYRSFIEHEKKCDRDAVFVDIEVYVLSRSLPSRATAEMNVKKNVILEDFVAQVRAILGESKMEVCLFVGVDAEERGVKPIDSDKNLKLAIQEQKVYVQICLFPVDSTLLNVKWRDVLRGRAEEDKGNDDMNLSLSSSPFNSLQLLSVWRAQDLRKQPAFVFPSAWVSGPGCLPYEWNVFADKTNDIDFSDHEAQKLTSKLLSYTASTSSTSKPFLIYYHTQPINWNKTIFQNELVYLRNTLSPLLHVLVSDSVQKSNIYQFFVVLPISLLFRISPSGCLNDVKEMLFSGYESTFDFKMFLTCTPPKQDNEEYMNFDVSGKNNSASGKSSGGNFDAVNHESEDQFLVVQVTINQGEPEGDEEVYASSLAAHLEDSNEQAMSLDMLERDCPPPEGMNMREIIAERPTMFKLTKDENIATGKNTMLVELANVSGDESEPEENVDWEPENHSDYEDDDESDLKDVVLAPEGSALLQFTKRHLFETGAPPSLSDFQQPFKSFALARSEGVIKELIASASLHRHWFSGPYARCVPGQDNFNAHAHRCMIESGLNQPESEFQIHAPEPGVNRLQPYQKTVSFLVHPFSPAQRMLVVHRTGAGKTLSMIRILDNFFHDPRPKIVVFPTETVANNFYLEILKFPNLFRSFVEAECPKLTSPSMSQHAKMTLVRDILMMRGVFVKGKMRKRWRMERENRLVPAAPVRAYSYMRAGGQTVTALDKKKQPRNALIKVMWDNEGKNPYTNKICLMDEIHNMTTAKTQFTNWKEKLVALQKMLSCAKNATIVGFTATPVQENAKEAYTLLSVIKGQQTDNHEGFVSFFHSAPTTVFPSVTPRGVPEVAMPEAVPVQLKGQNLSVYALKHSQLTQQRLIESQFVNRMTNYCSLGTFYTRANMLQEKKLLLDETEMFACKLNQIAKDVVSDWERLGGKAVVMLHRVNGWKAMAILLSHLCAKHAERANSEGKKVKCASYPPCLAHEREFSPDDILQSFNHADNDNGQNIAVLVVDAKEAGEGVSLLSVRRLYLGDTPHSWLEYQQRVGRAVRFCGHQRLAPSERNLHVKLYLTTCPGAGRQCAFGDCPNTNYTPTIIPEISQAPEEEVVDPRAVRVSDPQYKCATCSRWFCCPEHWAKGHPPCRGRNRMIDERLGLETADQVLFRRLKQAFAAGSPLTELKRVAVDGEILKPTLGEASDYDFTQVNDDAQDASIIFVPRPPSPPRAAAEAKTWSQENSPEFKMATKVLLDNNENFVEPVIRPPPLPKPVARAISPPRAWAPGGPPIGPASPYLASDYESD